ncbi:MAG: IS110 family transposase [Nitrospira sp.]|nr:IS110 family transposase [Nitrospira sp.]
MTWYAAIDLHSNNNVMVVIDAHDHVVYQQRLVNELAVILQGLAVYQADLHGIAIESTYNWYWLVDGLMEHGYRVHLVNTAAIHQYEGLKYTDDHSDACWLAHLLRLEDILPEGYMYPRTDRPVRDLLRKRSQMVRQPTTNLVSIQSVLTRNTGRSLNANRVKTLDGAQVDGRLPNSDLARAVKANLSVMSSAEAQAERLERTILDRVKLRPPFSVLKSVPGVGDILARTIRLETDDIGRLDRVGHFASYGRCVGSEKISNGKKKGQGNTKNGNTYRAWAFVEATPFAVRYNATSKRCYERKKAKTTMVVAIKTVPHKRCRACDHIMRNQVAFDLSKAFGPKAG